MYDLVLKVLEQLVIMTAEELISAFEIEADKRDWFISTLDNWSAADMLGKISFVLDNGNSRSLYLYPGEVSKLQYEH